MVSMADWAVFTLICMTVGDAYVRKIFALTFPLFLLNNLFVLNDMVTKSSGIKA